MSDKLLEDTSLTESENVEILHHKYVGGHHFSRVAAVSAIGGEFLHYDVKCVNCGITGRREDLQSPVKRSKEYADDQYYRCAKAKQPKGMGFKYKIGDEVVWTNSYGVNLGKRTIVGYEINYGETYLENAYFIDPIDTPWCSIGEKALKPYKPK